MCGLSGILSAAPVTPAQRAAVAAMSDRLVHRGPDDEGWLETGHSVMAMRRLAVIDLAGAAQPLANRDGSLALVFNGEIYNYRELRAELGALGYPFRTEGDGEVVLALYERYGLDFVHHLRGMFVIALWDSRSKRVVLARDRMGEKPLYLYETRDTLVFASEMKALLRSGAVDFALDPAAVHLYFHYQYVPEPLTAVRGVRKLDAGRLLVVDLEPWTVREIRYWSLEDCPPVEGDPATLIRERLDEASRLTLRSDVPIGVALSGGLDSSLIAALAARHAPGSVSAVTVGYPGRPPSDERREAEALSRILAIPFHEVELDPGEMVDLFPALNFWRDDPIADIAGFGYFAVMRKARELGIKVMLQGQGGDELFWGYEELRAARSAAHRAQRRRNGPLGRLLGRREGTGRMPFYDQAPDYRDAERNIRKHYSRSFAEAVRTVDPGRLFTFGLPWPDIDVALTERICATYLRENGIAQGERLAMASSVELRLPFMDHALVETVIGLRKHRSDSGLPAKAWLKAAAEGLVPPEILNRRKQGFAPPVRSWHGALFDRYGAMLADGHLVANDVLSPDAARALARGPFPAGAIAPLSFKALVLELWCRYRMGPA
ncbi:MAG TPA: asparagine synthase (glutamine-hydrolyzing) [Allosphingosinicella sp.]|nr:asparagine synthase (glutamine-hydrolyzing) [Allosphingosinicella sp.]